ncbi:MAG: NifU family protein [Solirubrobacterales bacterium]
MARVQELTERLERLPDQAARASADELVSAILELYGEGLERIFGAMSEEGEAGERLRERLQEDGLVASLMLIHDLYPIPLEERVSEALESVRPYMESHGGNVELLEVKDGTARISLEGSCKTCPASTSTLELAIKQALDEAAPDLEALIVEGAENLQPAVSGSAMELPVLQVAPGEEGVQPSWFPLPGAEQIVEGEVRAAEVAGVPLVVARVEGGLLAYRDSCAGCHSALHDGALADGTLTCPECARNFHLPRAGRSLDDDRLQLEPVPLLGGPEGTRVALAA